MERTPELFAKIEDYLNDQLIEEEKRAFEKQLEKDQSLADEMQKHKLLKEAVGDKEILAFQQKLNKVSAELKQEQSKPIEKSFDFRLVYKYAAAILLLVIAVYAAINSLPTDKNEEVFQAYYSPFPLESSLRGAAENNELITAKHLYKQGKYLDAMPELERLSAVYQQDYSLKLYLATCYFENSQYESAEQVLQSISESSSYRGKAEWYLALAKIKLGDSEAAIKILRDLSMRDSYFSNEAKEALKDLE